MTQKDNQNYLKYFLITGFNSTALKMAVAPLDRIKLILQNQHSVLQVTQGNQKYKGIFDCFFRVIWEEGFLSLYRGNGVNLVRYGAN